MDGKNRRTRLGAILFLVVLIIGAFWGYRIFRGGKAAVPETMVSEVPPPVAAPKPVVTPPKSVAKAPPVVPKPAAPMPAVTSAPVPAVAPPSPPAPVPAPPLPGFSSVAKPARPEAPFVVMPQTAPPGVVARIGAKGEITETDLSDCSAVESCYGPDASNSRRAAFMRMLEAAVTEELLMRDARISVSAGDYQSEMDRIDFNTRAPEVLNCIKKHFLFEKGKGFAGDGRQRYERVYLRKYVLGLKFADFMKSEQVQGDVYRVRDRVLAQAQEGASFADLAKEFSLVYSTRTFTAKEPKEKEVGLPPSQRWSPFEKQFIDDHLKALFPGQVKPAPIDSGRGFQFIRLISNAGGRYQFESLLLTRKNSEQYFDDRPTLPARIYDEELRVWLNGMPGHPMRKILQMD